MILFSNVDKNTPKHFVYYFEWLGTNTIYLNKLHRLNPIRWWAWWFSFQCRQEYPRNSLFTFPSGEVEISSKQEYRSLVFRYFYARIRTHVAVADAQSNVVTVTTWHFPFIYKIQRSVTEISTLQNAICHYKTKKRFRKSNVLWCITNEMTGKNQTRGMIKL